MGILDVPETDAENQIDIDPQEAREGKHVEVKGRMDLEEEIISAEESRESVVTNQRPDRVTTDQSETAREDTAQDRLFVDILSLVKPPRPPRPPPTHHHHGGQQQHNTQPGNKLSLKCSDN